MRDPRWTMEYPMGWEWCPHPPTGTFEDDALSVRLGELRSSVALELDLVHQVAEHADDDYHRDQGDYQGRERVRQVRERRLVDGVEERAKHFVFTSRTL